MVLILNCAPCLIDLEVAEYLFVGVEALMQHHVILCHKTRKLTSQMPKFIETAAQGCRGVGVVKQ